MWPLRSTLLALACPPRHPPPSPPQVRLLPSVSVALPYRPSLSPSLSLSLSVSLHTHTLSLVCVFLFFCALGLGLWCRACGLGQQTCPCVYVFIHTALCSPWGHPEDMFAYLQHGNTHPCTPYTHVSVFVHSYGVVTHICTPSCALAHWSPLPVVIIVLWVKSCVFCGVVTTPTS